MKRFLPWITFGLALLCLLAAYLYVSSAMSAKNETFSRQRPTAQETALDVTVVTVEASDHAAAIRAVGVAEPKQNLTLSSQVSGEVVSLNREFEVGNRVRKGQVLVSLANTNLVSELASAENTLAAAQLTLKEEQRQAEQSNAEWQAAGLTGEPASDLVLREPQLAAAEAEVAAAKAALAEAKDNVQKLTIRAPFDAIVVSKDISLGSYLSSNTQVATLYSTDKVKIELELSSSDWQKLPSSDSMIKNQWPANITGVNEPQKKWQGYVNQAGMHIDSESGLRSLFVAVDQPLQQSPPLLPGSYVTVTLAGDLLADLWQLPNSALSQKSQIWYLTDEQRLANFDATPVFVDRDYVYIKAPENLRQTPQRVLTHPYNSYLTGTLANPQESVSQ